MRFTNVTGLPASWTMGLRRDGRELLVVVVKGTFDLSAPHPLPLSARQMPLIEADVFTGEPGLSAPWRETDFAHGKPACDVLVLGSAHAPQGRPVKRLTVGVRVGGWHKALDVVGPRTWQRGIMGVSASEPEPFVCQRISYDQAWGGTVAPVPDLHEGWSLSANPVGVGYWRHTRHIDGQPMPWTEACGQAVNDPAGEYTPMGLSPLGRNWWPRIGHAGTYDTHWVENVAPLWPQDFDERYFQHAPPDQVLPALQGGEEVVLQHLSPQGPMAFRLPGVAMPVTFVPHQGRDLTQQARVDTLVIEPDAQRLSMTWRCVLPLGRNVFDVKELIVGEMSAAWHRSRRFPGKVYYSSLDDAVRASRSRASP
jgi:hypothetical protein